MSLLTRTAPRVCRVCLASDLQFHPVPSLTLQRFYETLTHVKLNNGRPESLCCYCVALLQKCCKFVETARRANTALDRWYHGHTDCITATPLHTYSKTKQTYINIDDCSEADDIPDVKAEPINDCLDNGEANISTYLDDMQTNITSHDSIFIETPNFDQVDPQIDAKVDIEDTNGQKNLINSENDSVIEIDDDNDSSSQVDEINNDQTIDTDIIYVDNIQEPFSLNKNKNKETITSIKQSSGKKSAITPDNLDIKRSNKVSEVKKCTVEKEKKLLNEENTFSCDLCDYTSYAMRYVNQHKTRVHSVEKSVSCPICKVTLDNITCLNEHVKNIHKQSNIRVKLLSCSVCDFKCLKKTQLKSHLERHSGLSMKCELCGYTNSSKIEMRKHSMTHIKDKRFTCDLCDFKTVTKIGLAQHRIDDHGCKENLFCCSMCEFQSINVRQLKSHLWKHRKEKNCRECGTEIQEIHQLNEHLKLHKETVTCYVCDYRCTNTIKLQNHLKNHIKVFSCDFCDHKFSKINNLKSHLLSHTGEKSHACDLCDYKTEFANNLRRHLLIHTDSRPYSCPECNSKHKSVNHLKNHMKIVHNKIDAPNTRKCGKCNFKCATLSQLRKHEEIVDHPTKSFRKKRGEKYSCDYCGFTTKRLNELEKHIFIHTGHKPYKCLECKAAFKCKEYLSTHIKYRHVCDKKICRRCGKCVPNQTELQNHVCRKQFLCDICGSKWKNSLLLKRHIMIHTGEKPFACELCPYRCSLESSMVKHMRIHTNEKPYACDKCSYRCAVISNLLRHLASHSNEKPFSCHICDAKYKIKRALKRHVDRLHGCSNT